jgi:hypothetical protein
MANGKKHLLISTIICAAPIFLFLAFYNTLPDVIPIQITFDGSVGNALPKPAFVFGFPAVFVVVNLAVAARKKVTAVYGYYIIPAIAVVLSVITLCMAFSLSV